MSGAAIAARGLEKRFGRAVALAGLDLDLPAGRGLAVLGPNGAGKTTLLRLVAGLARPSAGSLRIGEQSSQRREMRSLVGYVGHATLLYTALTARENLVFAGRLYGVADPGARADALLEEEGLAAVAQRPVGGFSRGMAQRVAIARGLVHDPPVVLLDEPFTGLDRRAAGRLAAKLIRLREAGHTLLLVTHDVSQAVPVCDEALVLVRGRVAHRSQGPLESVSLERAYEAALEASA